jgi:hypothetical protein
MNQEQCKEYRPFVDAAAEGKTVQYLASNSEWVNLGIVNMESCLVSRLRIKPTPKLRPWKPEEVPVGAVVLHKETGSRMLIEGTHNEVAFMRTGSYSLQALLNDWLYSIDFGKTWHPCGVM